MHVQQIDAVAFQPFAANIKTGADIRGGGRLIVGDLGSHKHIVAVARNVAQKLFGFTIGVHKGRVEMPDAGMQTGSPLYTSPSPRDP